MKIPDLISFFKKEKIYTVLAVLLLVIYGFGIFHGMFSKEAVTPKSSAALEEFKRAEKAFQEKVKDLGSLEKYLKDHPVLSAFINVFSIFVILALFAGIGVDMAYVFRPGFRSKFATAHSPSAFSGSWTLLIKFFILFFVMNILAGFSLLGFQKIFGGEENIFILVHTTFAELISFGVIFYLLRQSGGHLADIGLWKPDGRIFPEIRMGWMAYLGILPLFGIVLLLLIVITTLMHYEPPAHPLVPILLEGKESPFLIGYALFLACIVGPVFEEIFFRGFCYPILKKKFGLCWAMIFTSAFFAWIHESSFAFWPIFVLGLCLNYVYEKRKALIAPLTLHITHNVIFITYFFLAKNLISLEAGI